MHIITRPRELFSFTMDQFFPPFSLNRIHFVSFLAIKTPSIFNRQHTIFGSWNDEFFTPSTVSKIVVGPYWAGITPVFFQTSENAVMVLERLDLGCFWGIRQDASHVVPKYYSIYWGLWNVSPRDHDACWAQVVTAKIKRWTWWRWWIK